MKNNNEMPKQNIYLSDLPDKSAKISKVFSIEYNQRKNNIFCIVL